MGVEFGVDAVGAGVGEELQSEAQASRLGVLGEVQAVPDHRHLRIVLGPPPRSPRRRNRGLVRLSQGEAAFNHWLQYLKNPWMLAFHLVVLATFLYHTWSWFSIMPKTLPILFVGGKRVQPGTITATGIATAVIACMAVLFVVRGMHP